MWKQIDQIAMVKHFNDKHGANILKSNEYSRKKFRRVSPSNNASTAGATFAATPVENPQGNTTASDHFHTFARPSARDKMDTSLVRFQNHI